MTCTSCAAPTPTPHNWRCYVPDPATALEAPGFRLPPPVLGPCSIAFAKVTEEITTGRLPLFEEDTVPVIAHWAYAGQRFSLGEQLFAAALTSTSLPAFPTSGGGAS